MKKSLVLHPFLFALYPVFFLFSHNVEQVSFSEIIRPSLLITGAALIIFLSLEIFIKNYRKAGLIAGVILLLFLFYGRLYEVLGEWSIAGVVVGRNRYLLPFCAAFTGALIFFISKTKNNLHAITNMLNVISGSLLLISLINIAVYEISAKPSETVSALPVQTNDAANNSKTQRDIYYIVLDAYASSYALKEIYDYDNSDFINYLTEKGFYVAGRSTSNYSTTGLSLASILNMEYINYLSDVLGENSRDCHIIAKMVQRNKVVNFLKSKGYKYVHFCSGSGSTDFNNYADINFKCGKTNEFEMILLQSSALCVIRKKTFLSREKILCFFSTLAEAHTIQGAKFIFAHIICPHQPYLFGADGEELDRIYLGMNIEASWLQKDEYVNQLIFVNKRIKETVEKILQESEEPPVIIIQSDHGTAASFYGQKDIGWNNPTKAMLRERMRNFNAWFVPSSDYSFLYDSISSVNTFRALFNNLFDANFNLLEDKNFFSNYNQLYKLIDVTDSVKYESQEKY